MIDRQWQVRLAALSCAALLGCGTGGIGLDYGLYDKTSRPASGPALRVRWNKLLAPEYGGPYVPVEHAAAALDPRNARMYVGSSQKTLWAFEQNGRAAWTYQTESSIEAEPALDARRDELYVTTAAGHVHALRAYNGEKRWDVNLDAALSTPGVLSEDALYLVTDSDAVFAISRKDGSTLWKYQRDPRTGLKVTGHAGLLSSDQRLITGNSDGSIVALSKGDGRVLWVVDTTLDLTDNAQADTGFVDVDTTPVQVGDTVYAASFLAGLYALKVSDGVGVLHNAELTGVTSLAADERTITLVSAEHGIVCYDLPSLSVRWTRTANMRGAPTYAKLDNRTLFVTESRGALLALSIADGRELGRLQTEHGFGAEPSVGAGQGAIVGNSGIVYAFDY